MNRVSAIHGLAIVAAAGLASMASAQTVAVDEGRVQSILNSAPSDCGK
jgi:hypothetical protein